jgi:hypothetical protein
MMMRGGGGAGGAVRGGCAVSETATAMLLTRIIFFPSAGCP